MTIIKCVLAALANRGLIMFLLMSEFGSVAAVEVANSSVGAKVAVETEGLGIAENRSQQTTKTGKTAAQKPNNSSKVADSSSQQIIKRPQAKSVELNEPVAKPATVLQDNVLAPVVDLTAEQESEEGSPPDSDKALEAFVILDTEVLPGTATRLSWSPSQSFEGIATPTPVLIVKGAAPGPILCLTAATHGDELNGIEIVRRTLYDLKPEKLAGTVIGVPIVNLQGFRRSSRYLTDRRDLNRYFPGNPAGSSASRIAYSFFKEVVSHCDALVDLHTGSFHRTNLPQLRADITNPQVVELTQGFGSTVVLHSVGAPGTLRRAAVDADIPAVTLEAGESMRLQDDAVAHGVKGIQTLMSKMHMIDSFSFWGDPEPVYYNSIWVRASQGGILFSDVELGDKVDRDDLLGVVTDPITNIKAEIKSPNDGQVIGMALNQVVLPGFAAFHIGIRAPDEAVSEPTGINPQAKDVIEHQAQNSGEVTNSNNTKAENATKAKAASSPIITMVEPEDLDDADDTDAEVTETFHSDVDQYD